jgi:ribosomal protein S18 acetylase RimI-like enzyme
MNSQWRINLETADEDRISKELLKEVLRYNAQKAGPLNDARIVLTVRDGDNKMIAGLVAVYYWNGIFIDLLWVSESFRGRGIGTELMSRAETESKGRGGEIAFLSTWSFQAPAFYERLGYRAFGTLEGMPPGATRTWYWKHLGNDA